MELQIRQYDLPMNVYIRARASDLRDIRDRVSRVLTGATITAVPAGLSSSPRICHPSASWRCLEAVASRSRGSANSHVAMLARARGVPMLIGLDPGILQVHAKRCSMPTTGM